MGEIVLTSVCDVQISGDFKTDFIYDTFDFVTF